MDPERSEQSTIELGVEVNRFQERPLDFSDPVDIALAEFVRDYSEDRLLVGKEQRELIRDARSGDKRAAKDLVARHRGLVAAVARPFTEPGVERFQPLIIGGRGLLRAAASFNLQGETTFTDYALIQIHHELRIQYPEAGAASITLDEQSTLDWLQRIVKTITDKYPRELSELIETYKLGQAKKLGDLTLGQKSILPFLHLPTHEASRRVDISSSSFQGRVDRAVRATECNNRIELAIWAYSHGVKFETQLPPPIDRFTLRERQIGVRLQKEDAEIAAELGLSKAQVRLDLESLTRKIGSRTRVETALVSWAYRFEPTPKELDEGPEVLKRFTPFQRRIIPHLHLPNSEIASLAEVSPASVINATRRIRKVLCAVNQVDAVIQLSHEGVEFNVRKPLKPLSEILSKSEAEIVGLLVKSEEEIAELTGLELWQIAHKVRWMRVKTGARTRAELVLMVERYSTNEWKPDSMPRQEQFFNEIGIQPVADSDLGPLLACLTPRQREFILDYYLGDPEVTWHQVAVRRGLTNQHSVVSTVRAGISRLRRAAASMPQYQSSTDHQK